MNEKLGPQAVNILTSGPGMQNGADRTQLTCDRQQVTMACRAVSADRPVFYSASWQQNCNLSGLPSMLTLNPLNTEFNLICQ